MRKLTAVVLIVFAAAAGAQTTGDEPLAGLAMQIFNDRHQEARLLVEKRSPAIARNRMWPARAYR